MRLTVIGAGPGGYVAALRAARLGASVTVIEDTEVGGTCLNRGCIPTKALVASAELYAKTKVLDDYGLVLEGTVRPDLGKMMLRKDRIVQTQVKGIRALFKSWGVRLIEGRGLIKDRQTVLASLKEGGTEEIASDNIIIATGSRPAPLRGIPYDGTRIISSDEALKLTEIPKSVLIAGAGVIGLEWACILRELGAEVTMVELQNRILPGLDRDITEVLERELKKKKIKLLLGKGVKSAESGEEGLKVTLSDEAAMTVDKMLVTVGRLVNTGGLGLEGVGVKTDPRGMITVDDKMRTNIENIYAVGDVTGWYMLAHVASHAGQVAASNACGQSETMSYACIPSAIFTAPEIASVGMGAEEAERNEIKAASGTFQYRALGKSHAMGEIAGMFKVVSNALTDTVLGVQIIGPHASDLIHEGALAVRFGLKASDMAETIHAHPTLSEGLMEAAADAGGQALHAMKK